MPILLSIEISTINFDTLNLLIIKTISNNIFDTLILRTIKFYILPEW